MRRSLALACPALAWLAFASPAAEAHSALVSADPAPGARLSDSPRQLSLAFTEPLNGRLSNATLVAVADGRKVKSTSAASGKRLVLKSAEPLDRGAYRVRWHTVSTEDGHALEGTLSFGVRAPAAGGTHDVEQSPLARYGVLRVLARGLLYATLLVFSGALLLDALLRRRGESWLVPASVRESATGLDLDRVEERRQRLVLDLGIAAAGAASLSALADATDAAGGLSARRVSDFLLEGTAGLTRIYVVVLVLVALTGAAMRVRLAAGAALAALLSVAASGHANASSPRGLAIANDWVHLASASVWLGGIALLVAVWWPPLRRASRQDRLTVAREVLPRFGRVALPAFLVVVLSGAVNAVIELGRASALWQTDYGRVLAVKVGLVSAMAATSYVHALRLRPRLLSANPHPPEGLERRHWRLLRVEPFVGAGVLAAVALLVAFPLPPRQLTDAEPAAAPTCDPCPLPRPRRDELVVAEQGGSDVVAAWMRRDGADLVGTVRLYGLDDRPAHDPLRIVGAQQRGCGTGCVRFRLARTARVVTVTVRQRGREYAASLPATWQPDRDGRARRLVRRAQSAMRELESVREIERVSSVPGIFATTAYRLRAPDRMAFATGGGVTSVVVGENQWTRGRAGERWRKERYGGGLQFRTRSWFRWTPYARYAYLLELHRDVAVVALYDPGTPAWWRLSIDLRTYRVPRDRLVTYGHFMTQRFFAFNEPLVIRAPGS